MGYRSDDGVEAFARESWKSGRDLVVKGEVVAVLLEGDGADVTTISRHWGPLDWEFGLVRGRDPVGVARICEVSSRFGATDWKA